MANTLTIRMSKRVNYSGEPSKRAKKAGNRRPKSMSVEQLVKNAGTKKGVDIPLGQVAVLNTTSTNGSAYTLNLVAPGDASFNRQGRKIYCKSVRLTGTASYVYGTQTSTSNLQGSTLRMVVVWDKDTGGSLPTFGDIFGVTLQDGTEQSQVYSPPRYDNMERFQVLRDKLITCNPALNPPTGGSANNVVNSFHFDEFIKLGNRTTSYKGQSSPCTVADIAKGGLYVYFRADTDTLGDTEWYIEASSNARLRYSD